jgi:hypothetical protein
MSLARIICHVQLYIPLSSLCVMLALVLKLTNYHINFHLVVLLLPWSLFFGCLGPAIDSFGHKKYYVSFIDDYSKGQFLSCHCKNFQSLVCH